LIQLILDFVIVTMEKIQSFGGKPLESWKWP